MEHVCKYFHIVGCLLCSEGAGCWSLFACMFIILNASAADVVTVCEFV